ncbi:hypothetical protein [Pleionea mediterranea]|uniref:Ig-like domain-containing protein n=1 Tax=Pleionea mediterranea TaxID=523701 RepID=A0A316FD28_9GAMM|nr:hypothetical protein [Pleionea mediterranea]PWK46319.1 hypothetical protein C8D97_1132 [Pleionea mediterranea]
MIKGTLLLLVGVGLADYIYLSMSLKWKFRLPTYQGHHLFYRILQRGLWFFSAAIIIYVVAWPFTSNKSSLFVKFEFVFPNLTQVEFNFIIISLNSIILSYVCVLITNELRLWKYIALEVYENDSRIRSDYLEDLNIQWKRDCVDSVLVRNIYDSAKTGCSILITLKNRKSYVCIISQFMQENDSPEHKEITIYPMRSGYRDESDLSLELITNYKQVNEALRVLLKRKEETQIIEALSVLNSYAITIKIEDIVSLSRFDFKHYKKFKEEENTRREQIQGVRNN